MLQIRPISAPETHFLRQKILRSHQDISEMNYPNDDHSDSVHMGAFLNNELVGIASIFHESQKEGRMAEGEWRLRGMAVEETQRGAAVGQKLLQSLVEHVQKTRGDLLWCNARTSACGFYEKHGFQKFGNKFEIPSIGDHFVMVLEM